MKHIKIIIVALLSVIVSSAAYGHHSFAIYDIDNKIERTGVITKFRFTNPHIQIVLEVDKEDGSKEVWEIESMSPNRWDTFNYPRDVMAEGETVTLLGWPARNGDDEMTLSTIITDRAETVIVDEVKQRRAREDLPEETIKRE